MELGPYSSLLVAIVSDDDFSFSIIPIKGKNGEKDVLPMRNLSLVKCFNQGKCFAESRRSELCLKGRSVDIEDISSTDLQVIDSLNKVWLVAKDLEPFESKDQDFVTQILKWDSLS